MSSTEPSSRKVPTACDDIIKQVPYRAGFNSNSERAQVGPAGIFQPVAKTSFDHKSLKQKKTDKSYSPFHIRTQELSRDQRLSEELWLNGKRILN